MLPGSSPERIGREVKDGQAVAAARRRSSASSGARCGPCATCEPSASARSSSTATSCRPTAAPARRRSAAATSRCTTPSAASCRPAASPTHPLTAFCAAISVGIVGGTPVLDLPYVEDSRAEVDMNVVMTSLGGFVEVQGTAEGAPFSRAELDDAAGPGRGRHQRDHRPAAARWSSEPPGAVADAPAHGDRATPTRSPRSQAILGPMRTRSRRRDTGRGGDGGDLRGERPPQGARAVGRRRVCSPWRTTPASRSTTSAARPASSSARWTGEGDWIPRVLRELDGVGPAGAAAGTSAPRRRCGPTAARSWCGATVEGVIVEQPRGEGGFGYDPIVAPIEGDGRTFARDDRRREARHQPSGQGLPAGHEICALPPLAGQGHRSRASPAAEVDVPHLDDLVAVDEVEALVLRDRRVDVGGDRPAPGRPRARRRPRPGRR